MTLDRPLKKTKKPNNNTPPCPAFQLSTPIHGRREAEAAGRPGQTEEEATGGASDATSCAHAAHMKHGVDWERGPQKEA